MPVYLNELYTHPFWTVCLIIFLWRTILSFRYPDSGRELVLVVTLFLLLMAVSPVFIHVPKIENKTMYGAMYLLVFPVVAARAAYSFRNLIKSNEYISPYPAIAGGLICASLGFVSFIGGLLKLFF